MRRFNRSIVIWLLLCTLSGTVFMLYLDAGRSAGRGELLMPLDDVYIHFQYARQMALGQPYVYNPGEPPTSGATSFLYPFILAGGYALGFQGLNLGVWAMLIGTGALAGAAWLVYRLAQRLGGAWWLALGGALCFILTGAVQWHFMSGMETGLVTLLLLGTLDTVLIERPRAFAVVATLLALIRPEGSILAVIAALMMAVYQWQRRAGWRQIVLCCVPILALSLQPLVNLLVTGSAVATGNAAKSILGNVPFDLGIAVQRIVDNFVRMVAELLSGVSPREGLYTPWLVGPLALLALLMALLKRQRALLALLVLAWLAAGLAAISTLDTAFWHFKRYQLPFMALLYPLAVWGLVQLGGVVPRGYITYWRVIVGALMGAGLLVSMQTSRDFLRYFVLNAEYVYEQPLQMARWLREKTPPSAVVAVHDVGLMRYMGDRITLDMVGLTTPDAAIYWRNGPGSVGEFLLREQPDYIAAYGEGHGLGLGMLAQTPLYANALATFPVTLDDLYNVALAAPVQGVYQPDYQGVYPEPQQWGTQLLLADRVLKLVDQVNVADLDSEVAHDYDWAASDALTGFPTVLYDWDSVYCGEDAPQCNVLDGGRMMDEVESFTLNTVTGQDLLLITRVHPMAAGTYEIYVNDALVATRVLPQMPGRWLEITTLIPAEHIIGAQTHIRIEPVAGTVYAPFYHWAYQGDFDVTVDMASAAAAYPEAGFVIGIDDWRVDAHDLTVPVDFYNQGEAQGDYRFFVHLYADTNQPPVTQYDAYPAQGTLLPGNWLPGVLRDRATLSLEGLPAGRYQLALGFYNPVDGARLQPQSEQYPTTPDGRLWLGEITLPAPEVETG